MLTRSPRLYFKASPLKGAGSLLTVETNARRLGPALPDLALSTLSLRLLRSAASKAACKEPGQLGGCFRVFSLIVP